MHVAGRKMGNTPKERQNKKFEKESANINHLRKKRASTARD